MIFLGQNVNSYRDLSDGNGFTGISAGIPAPGFKTVYRHKVGGLRFIHLLDAASLVDPNMRIRFTSPHPKDFNNDVRSTFRVDSPGAPTYCGAGKCVLATTFAGTIG